MSEFLPLPPWRELVTRCARRGAHPGAGHAAVGDPNNGELDGHWVNGDSRTVTPALPHVIGGDDSEELDGELVMGPLPVGAAVSITRTHMWMMETERHNEVAAQRLFLKVNCFDITH